MEVVNPIVSEAVVQTVRPLCGSIYSTIKKIVKGPQLDLLENKMKSLMALRGDAAKEMESAKTDGILIKAQVTDWLGKVEGLKRKYDQIQKAKSSNDQIQEANDEIQEAKSSRCFLSCVTKRYRISTEVAERLKEIEGLLEEGRSYVGSVALSCKEVKAVEHIPGPSIQDQTTSISEDLAKTMTLLSDDKNRIIGIWGMGGVGKTTLVRNLNNELQNNSNLPFSCVLWITVSKNLDIKKLQMRIASRLGFHLNESSGEDGMAIQLHRRLKQESFLLILDDVWEKIELDILGVPRPKDHRGCKIILTSRSLEVCNAMLTDYNFKMNVLRDKDAWQLFSRYANDVVSSEHIAPFAEAICRECKGLPLAIITMGAAMRGKTNPEVWKHALNQLRRSVPFVANVEKELYNSLKWSYNSLEGKDLKSCFLYCSLFSEDFPIKIYDLVWYWVAEGLIDDRENYENSFSRGISLIENLKEACLLEDGPYEGTVKMHDVVRDVSIWIASTCSSEDGSKSLVRSGNGLKEISATELSNSLKRVSFMDNNLERLPDDSVIQCSEASTLLLQENRSLNLIPERFLGGFEALRVLNISWTSIKSLPISLLQLDDLRALILRDCRYLKELPSLESLIKLQVLDLCGTWIRRLPRGLEQLRNLRHLNLRNTYALKAVKAGVISKLSSLEVLELSDNGYNWKVKGGVQEEQACLEELQYLERLRVLSIELEWIPCHSSQYIIILTNRLTTFRIRITSPTTYFDVSEHVDQPWTSNPRCVIMYEIDLSGELNYWLRDANLSDLGLISCGGLNEMLQDLVINGCSLTYLKKLDICDFDSSFQIGGCAAQYDLLPNLEELTLRKLKGVESLLELVNHLGLRFQRLKAIHVIGCKKMKYLLSLGDSIRTMPNLEVIFVNECSNLEELFNYFPLQTDMASDSITPKLQNLKLWDLPKLRNLCREEKTWPGIDRVEVYNCNLLSTEQ